MSLTLRNLATEAQLDWLKEHGYYGKMQLTKTEAEQLIDEYIEQERLTLTTRQRGYLELLVRIDPQYLERYKFIRSLGKE